MKHKNRFIILSAFILTLFVVLLQYANVFFYHDDFAYLTLSYRNLANFDIQGTNYGLMEILHFLYAHYLNHGGRVLYFFFEIVIAKNGIWFWRIFQSIIVSILLLIMYGKSGKWRIANILLVISLFFALPLPQMADGMYWMTASSIYVVPMVPFFLSCIEFFKVCFNLSRRQMSNRMLYLVLFLATFSQEQISCAAIFFVSICATGYFISNRKLKDSSEHFKIVRNGLVISYVGFFCVIFAPGNFVRVSQNSSSNLFIDRIATAMHYINLEAGKYFQFIVLCAFIVLTVYLFFKRKKYVMILCPSFLFLCWLQIVSLKSGDGIYNSLTHLFQYNGKLVIIILMIFFVIETIVLFLFYKTIRNNMEMFLFWCCGIIILAILVVSPAATPYRATLPFYIIEIFVISNAMIEVINGVVSYNMVLEYK